MYNLLLIKDLITNQRFIQIFSISFLLFSACSKGKLKIESNPSQAEVYLDEEYKGKTPLEIQISAGNYKVHIKKGDKGYFGDVAINADATQFIKAGLGSKTIWSKTFGGSEWDRANSIIASSDGGFAVAGYTKSYGNGDRDLWVIKLDKSGNKLWAKTFGGSKEDGAYSIIASSDGGFTVAGYTKSYGNGSYDSWVIRLDKSGNKLWAKTFGGSEEDVATSIVASSDGGFIVAGYTESYGNGSYDFWVIKLDKSGNKLWSKTFGGSKWDEATSIVASSDGGFAVAGETYSYGNGSFDVWVIKLDKSGNKLWAKTFGGSEDDVARSIVATSDSDFAVSYGNGKGDFWVIKFKDSDEISYSYAPFE